MLQFRSVSSRRSRWFAGLRTSLGLMTVGIGWVMGPGAAAGVAAEAKPIHAELLQRFEARVYRDAAGAQIKYRLFKPAAGSLATNVPLVLFLHGAAGLGDDNARQFNGGNEVPPLALIADEAQSRFPCFVVAPQCPRGESWSAYGGKPGPALRLTVSTIDALTWEFHIDRSRLYVVGVSMGGRGVWDAVLNYPETFAAAVPICAAGEPDGLGRIKTLPVWCFHGGADPLVPVETARRTMSALRRAGGNPKYTEYPGVGHDSYRNAFKEPDLLPWLFSHRRGRG